jgi:hypothetical protein
MHKVTPFYFIVRSRYTNARTGTCTLHRRVMRSAPVEQKSGVHGAKRTMLRARPVRLLDQALRKVAVAFLRQIDKDISEAPYCTMGRVRSGRSSCPDHSVGWGRALVKFGNAMTQTRRIGSALLVFCLTCGKMRRKTICTQEEIRRARG